MQDFKDKVRAALEVYLKRGLEALGALQGENAEEFFQIMTRRDAAFHNFRALDALALAAGADVAADPVVRRLWREIDQVNRTLTGVMTDAQTSMDEKLTRMRAFRSRANAYQSGTPPVLRLVKQV